MNEHRPCVPLRAHRLLAGLFAGIFLFLEGFNADLDPPELDVCSICLCDRLQKSVICNGLLHELSEDTVPLPLETRVFRIDGSCGLSRLVLDSFTNYSIQEVSITNSCLNNVKVIKINNKKDLVKLDISGNALTNFDSFENVDFKNLKHLTLDRNNFVNISFDMLASLQKLEYLSMRDNLIHDIRSFTEHFKGLSSLTRLDLTGNPLKAIAVDGLVNLPPSLRTLILSDCVLVDIHDDAFRNVSEHLLELDLSGNHLSLNQLKGLFLGFKEDSAIRILRLARLDLEEIPPDPLWIRMPGLEVLDFSGNRIDDVSYLAFEGLHLRELYLDYNKITTLGDVENDTNLHHLVVLSLSNNQIETIPVFRLPFLTRINLGANKITQIFSTHFASMPQLQSVNVTKNAITHIDPSAFIGVEVRTLDVSQNDIKNWEWVTGLHIVEHLNLSGNTMPYLTADSIKSTGQMLLSLDLSSSGIKNVAHDSFVGFITLQHLRLGGNHFGHQIESGSLKQLFLDLTDLISLDMSSLDLVTIPMEQFGNLTSLRQLYLSDNMISQLCDTASRHLGESLHVFEVRRNRLKEIDTDYLKHLPSLKKVNFAQNPFHCGCAVDTFRQWINESKTEVVDFHGEGYVCTSPESARGVQLQEYAAQDCQGITEANLHIVLASSVGISLSLCIIVLILLYNCKRFAFLKKPRYAYVGGDEFEWSGKGRVFYAFSWCRKIRSWCPKPRSRKNSYMKHSHSQPLTEGSVC